MTYDCEFFVACYKNCNEKKTIKRNGRRGDYQPNLPNLFTLAGDGCHQIVRHQIDSVTWTVTKTYYSHLEDGLYKLGDTIVEGL